MAASISTGSHSRWGTVAVAVLGFVGMPVWLAALRLVFAPTPPANEALAALTFIGLLFSTPLTLIVVVGVALVCWAPAPRRKRLAAALIAVATVVARAVLAVFFS